MSLAKRARHLEAEETLLLNDDGALAEAEAKAWREEVAMLAATNTQWVDPDFPATQISIKGKEESAPAAAPEPQPPVVPGVRPKCRCGADAASATVSKDTPNKGRAYYHCPTRACGFFAWADGGEVAFQRGGTAAALQWARLPQELHIVSDFGFRAQDLRQGGVGDCWFMSALAVVAERHDLIAALFAVDTARNAAGLYCLRLFLDGAWRSVRIDDLLPVTAAPRREVRVRARVRAQAPCAPPPF